MNSSRISTLDAAGRLVGRERVIVHAERRTQRQRHAVTSNRSPAGLDKCSHLFDPGIIERTIRDEDAEPQRACDQLGGLFGMSCCSSGLGVPNDFSERSMTCVEEPGPEAFGELIVELGVRGHCPETRSCPAVHGVSEAFEVGPQIGVSGGTDRGGRSIDQRLEHDVGGRVPTVVERLSAHTCTIRNGTTGDLRCIPERDQSQRFVEDRSLDLATQRPTARWSCHRIRGHDVHNMRTMRPVLDIPTDYHDLLVASNTAVFTTLLADGSPNSSPVWFWFDGHDVIVSTLSDRSKHRNVLRDPRVSFTVIDPDRPLRYIEIRATVGIEPDPDGEMRDRIAAKHGYDDGSAFDAPGATRVNLRLSPTRIIEH